MTVRPALEHGDRDRAVSQPAPSHGPTRALLDCAEAAAALGISESLLKRHIADGAIRVVLIGRGKVRRHVRIAPSDIEDFKDSRSCQFPCAGAPPSGSMTSRSRVYDFKALRKKLRGATPSAPRRGSGSKRKPT
jgi:hypothetical protein